MTSSQDKILSVKFVWITLARLTRDMDEAIEKQVHLQWTRSI